MHIFDRFVAVFPLYGAKLKKIPNPFCNGFVMYNYILCQSVPKIFFTFVHFGTPYYTPPGIYNFDCSPLRTYKDMQTLCKKYTTPSIRVHTLILGHTGQPYNFEPPHCGREIDSKCKSYHFKNWPGSLGP